MKNLAATGYGSWLCCSDLNTIFDYYYNHNGTYREDNSFVQETLHYPGGYCTIPRGIKNFLKAYADYAEEMNTLFKNYEQYAKEVKIAKQNAKWNDVGYFIGNIKTIVEKSSEYLWLLPFRFEQCVGLCGKSKIVDRRLRHDL